ncbi:hypothetical protein MF1_05270 [Bartonella quintana]|nr:hypothetical protein MF1_05270 [Bartonella quintana]
MAIELIAISAARIIINSLYPIFFLIASMCFCSSTEYDIYNLEIKIFAKEMNKNRDNL